MSGPTIMSVGHSTRVLDEFVQLLRTHGVDEVHDIRRYPGSRRNPQYSREPFARALADAGIGYVHDDALGGRRRPQPDSPNNGWRNEQFRGYADHMATEEFTRALDALIERARTRTIVVMCAEAVPWRCHRSLLADALVVRGIAVEHIISGARRDAHVPTAWARPDPARAIVTYPAEQEQLPL